MKGNAPAAPTRELIKPSFAWHGAGLLTPAPVDGQLAPAREYALVIILRLTSLPISARR